MNATANIDVPSGVARRENLSLEKSRFSAKNSRAFSQSITPARSTDIQSLIRLAGANVPQVAANTVWEIPWTWKHYRVVRDSANQVIGAGALLPLDNRLAEIRGLVVDDMRRSSGIATKIVEHLLGYANKKGVDAVCVTRRPKFFRKFGFQESSPAWLNLRLSPVRSSRSAGHSGVDPIDTRVVMVLAGKRGNHGSAAY